MIAAVLFDLDGTLADTAPDMARTVNEMCARRGLAPVDEAKVRPHVSRGARGMLHAAFGVEPEDSQYRAMRDEFLAIYEENLCVGSRLFPGMPELLEWLEADGISWGVVTNKYERLAKPLMQCFGLAERVGVVVGGDTCKRANTLYVGDDERDVQAARAAGMPVLVAGYGYLGDGPPAVLWGADAIIDSPAGVEAWIREKAAKEAA